MSVIFFFHVLLLVRLCVCKSVHFAGENVFPF